MDKTDKMDKMDIILKIRLCQRNKNSQRKTARILGISRGTVSKYWSGKHLPVQYEANINPRNITRSEYNENLTKCIIEVVSELEKDTTTKQRITAVAVHKAVSKRMIVGYSTVTKYLREIITNRNNVFLKLSYKPGQVMQVDWTEINVRIGAEKTKVKVTVFCANLRYSNRIFTIPMINMKFYNLGLAHIETFKYMGGIPEEIWYDNMKTVVKKYSGAKALENQQFTELRIHYGFKAVYMNAAKGNEKGGVENLCKTLKASILTGLPHCRDIKELADVLRAKCDEYNNKHRVQKKSLSIAELYKQEQEKLNPIPDAEYTRLNVSKRVKVNHHMFFSYNTNNYSVPKQCAGKYVTIVVSAHMIKVYYKGTIVAEHVLEIQKDKYISNFKHFISLLVKKPRARGSAYFLNEGPLPYELEEFRKYLENNGKSLEELGNTVILIEEYNITDEKIFYDAIRKANDTGAPTYQKIKFNLVQKLNEIRNINELEINIGSASSDEYNYLDCVDDMIGLSKELSTNDVDDVDDVDDDDDINSNDKGDDDNDK
ncbi:MAG: IS21 family transposase [Methanobrevibacter sp.]|jgi:transposase|nr:IS21 family transposase [Candidatus Methanovirga basalitermitum]